MAKKLLTCPECGKEAKFNGNHRVTCGDRECVRNNKIKKQKILEASKPKKRLFKCSPEATEFLKKFNFDRLGFKEIKRHSRALSTILTCLLEYQNLDEFSKLKIKEI